MASHPQEEITGLLLYGSYTKKWIRDECKMMVMEKL